MQPGWLVHLAPPPAYEVDLVGRGGRTKVHCPDSRAAPRVKNSP